MRMLAGVLLFLATPLLAQTPAPTAAPATAPTISGQVSGRVFCGDTDQPARFASVQLVGEHPPASPVFDKDAFAKEADPGKAFANAMTAVMKGGNSSLSALTNLDGAFSLDKVPPGTYWVVAQLAGYLSPLSELSFMERAKPGDDALKTVQATAEKIVVQPSQSAHVDIRIQRGASISGTVRFDDGSPAPGVNPTLLKLDKDGKWKQLAGTTTMPINSDDHGHYRLFGLQPGKYAVKAALPTIQAAVGLGAMPSIHSSMGDMLTVYSGGALHEKDIKPVEVGAGDDVDGVDVIFPLDNLHTVGGTVVAKSDQHTVNSGWVSLADADTKEQVRGTEIEPDGSFHLNYILDGQYTLKVSGAADTEKSADAASAGIFAQFMPGKTLKSYDSIEMPLTVKSESTGLVLLVPDAAAKPAKNPVAAQTPPAP